MLKCKENHWSTEGRVQISFESIVECVKKEIYFTEKRFHQVESTNMEKKGSFKIKNKKRKVIAQALERIGELKHVVGPKIRINREFI